MSPNMPEPGMTEVPKLLVAEFDRIPKAAYFLAAQLVFWQLFFEQKVFLYVKMILYIFLFVGRQNLPGNLKNAK